MQFTVSSACRLALFGLLTAQPAITLAHPTLEERSLPVLMGVASAWGAIAGTALTSTGNTLITGNCGTCPGISITGFPPGVCTGTKDAGGTAACAAEAACLTAYNNAKGLSPSIALPASDLGGVTLPPGVYTFPTAGASLTGNFTANGTANHNGQWIFKMSTTFTTAAGSKILLINGAQACNIYFQIGSSATLAANCMLQGNFLAHTSITVGSTTSNNGTLCAINGGVSLINDALKAQTSCAT